jgi:hypothetical protein
MNYISQNIERCNFNNEFIFTFILFYVLSNLFFNILDSIFKLIIYLFNSSGLEKLKAMSNIYIRVRCYPLERKGKKEGKSRCFIIVEDT